MIKFNENGEMRIDFATQIAVEVDNTITELISQDLPKYIGNSIWMYTYRCNTQKIADAIEKHYKYRWHDLRKDPDDLPALEKKVECVFPSGKHRFLSMHKVGDEYVWEENLLTCVYMDKLNTIRAWREIEPFEVEK